MPRRWRLSRKGVSQCPSTMIALRWISRASSEIRSSRSAMEILIDRSDPPDQLLHVVEKPLRPGEVFVGEPAAADGDDRRRGAVRSKDIVRRIADDRGPRLRRADLLERR